MASGSINLTSNEPNYVSGRIDWQSYANNQGNYSTVSVQVFVILNSWGIQGTGSGQFKVNGSTVANFSPYINIAYGGYGTVQVFSKNDIIVNHNENGDATVNLGCEMSFSFAGISSISGSQTVSMDHIDRYLEITKFKATEIGISTAKFEWAVSEEWDKAYYSVNSGAEVEITKTNFEYDTFEPNETQSIKLRVRRKSNKLWTEKTIKIKTLDYARILDINTMDVEASQVVTYKINPSAKAIVTFKAYCNNQQIFSMDLSDEETSFILQLGDNGKQIVYSNTTESNNAEIFCELITYTTAGSYEDTQEVIFTLSNIDPILNDFTYEEGNTICENLTGGEKFIKNYSNIIARLNQSDYEVQKFYDVLSNIKHIEKVRVECGTSYNEATYLITSSFPVVVNNINGTTLTMKIYDSRGNIGQLSKTIELIDYINILIDEATAERVNGTSTIVNVNLKGSIDLVDFGDVTNSLKALDYRKRRINEEYTDNWTTILSSATTNSEKQEFTLKDKEISGFTLGYEYELQIRAKDELSESIITIVVNSGEPLVCFNRTKKLVGIGKIPDTSLPEESLDVAGDIVGDNIEANEINASSKVTINNKEVYTYDTVGGNNVKLSNSKLIDSTGINHNGSLLSNLLKTKILWTNNSPSSGMPDGTNIYLSSSDYDFLIWIFTYTGSSSDNEEIGICLKGKNALLSTTGYNTANLVRRVIDYETDTRYSARIAYNGSNTSTTHAVPLYAIGIKFTE